MLLMRKGDLMMIGFNVPPYMGDEFKYIKEAIDNQHICGDGLFTKKVSKIFEDRFNCKKVLLTTSCTDALEMCALLLDIQKGDEVICPSFTFVSSALAFAMRGAKIVFVDIRPDTMNIDENKIEQAITEKTKAIVVVHYAGVSCEMNKIMDIANRHNIKVVEDAAQGVMSEYNDKALGTIAHLGTFSFHETKNYSSGEGGCLLVNDDSLIERAEIIREKGTNRAQFFRGQVDKYSWRDLGSSYLMSDINAAYLYAQVLKLDDINEKRLKLWNRYYQRLNNIESISLPIIPEGCKHNAHMFYIKCKDLESRTKFISWMKERGVQCVFHYIPLHSAPAGIEYGRFNGEDQYTTVESERLVRLPMYYSLTVEQVDYICELIHEYFEGNK